MTKETKIYTMQVPAVSHEFASTVARAFPVLDVRPGVQQDQLMFNAGQQSVIQWINKNATGSKIIGDPEQIKPEKANKSLLDRLLGVTRR